MKPSSSNSESLFGALFDTEAGQRELTGEAWLRAMLDTERALAAAQARVGLVPAAAAEAIAECCVPDRFSVAELAAAAAGSGNPVIPLVKALNERVPEHARPYVHFGATSQDVLDTAAMLVAHRASMPILADLRATADACARLAEEHRNTVLAARTLLQQALPTTFGFKAAGWLVALDEATGGLAEVRERQLAVQFGGAVGTLASLGSSGVAVLGALATELGLAEPAMPWHTDRTRLGALAGALGTVAGVLGKIAVDVELMAQTEIGELSEATGGGSSTMPHKRNPVHAVLVNAASRRVPGLVSTLLAGMAQEHERAAGGWHAEWETLTELLRLVGSAAEKARTMLTGLRVHGARMRRNLELTGGLLMAESVAGRLAPALGRGNANELVARLCRTAVAEDRPVREVLLAEPTVREQLTEDELDAALDPLAYLGSAGEFIDRALAAHKEGGCR